MEKNQVKLKQKTKYLVRNSIVNYYLLAMFTIFPIFLTEQYAHARTDKYVLFIVLSALLIVLTLIFSLGVKKEEDTITLPQNMFKLSIPDIMFLTFFLCALISTIFSPYFLDSLTGNAGRNNGLILLLIYLFVYLIITRFYIIKEYVIVAYLVISSFVAALAVLNYFYVDPFGLLKGYTEDVAIDFGTTIGNKNTTASFMCIFLPIAIMLFVICTKRYLKVLSGISIVFSYTGLLVSDSSSGFLGLFAIIIIMLLFCIRKYNYLRRYMLALIIAFSSGKVIRILALIVNGNTKLFDDFADFLVFSPITYSFILIPLVIFLILTLFKSSLQTNYKGKVPFIIVLILFILSILSIGFFFVYYSFIDTNTELEGLNKLFRFDESWGTHRGYMWINGLKAYSKSDIFKILFGSGPDTFYYVFEPYFEGLKNFGDSSTDCIHNEYLNYLVTQGIFGLITYLGLSISVIIRAIKKAKNNPVVLVTVSAVICYLIQAVVNIYQPITTPLLIIFISITESLSRTSYLVNDTISNEI